MPLAEHDNVVKTFPPDRTDRPFTVSILPRRSRRGWPIPNAHRPKTADEDVTVDGVAVTNDVLRRYFPTAGLGELARNPFSRWVTVIMHRIWVKYNIINMLMAIAGGESGRSFPNSSP